MAILGQPNPDKANTTYPKTQNKDTFFNVGSVIAKKEQFNKFEISSYNTNEDSNNKNKLFNYNTVNNSSDYLEKNTDILTNGDDLTEKVVYRHFNSETDYDETTLNEKIDTIKALTFLNENEKESAENELQGGTLNLSSLVSKVSNATALNTTNKEAKVNEAKTQIEALPFLSQDEKQALIASLTSAANPEDISTQTTTASQQNTTNKEAKINEAKAEIQNLGFLTDDEKQALIASITSAANPEAIATQKTDATQKNTTNKTAEIEKARAEIEKLNISDKEKEERIKSLESANSFNNIKTIIDGNNEKPGNSYGS
ncbi:UNVERIFIED_CONTAM: hypothetical protein O8I53_13245 [Campylobacter lari]